MSDLVAGPSGVSPNWGTAPRMPPSIEALRKAALSPAGAPTAAAASTFAGVLAALREEGELFEAELSKLAAAAQRLDGGDGVTPERLDLESCGLVADTSKAVEFLAAQRRCLAALANRIVTALG